MSYRIFKPSAELFDVVELYWLASIKGNCYSKQQYNTPLFEGMVFNFLS